MASSPVGWFEIYVQDMERARRSYEAVFQNKLEKPSMPGIEMLTVPMNMESTAASGARVKMP